MFYQQFKKICFNLFLTLLGLLFVSAFPSLFVSTNIGFNLESFFSSLANIIDSLVNINSITYTIQSRSYPLFPNIFEPYFYSLKILFSSFLFSVLCSILLAYITFQLPIKIRKWITRCFVIIQSIPDVFFVFSLQLTIIWVYKKTNILFLDPLSSYQHSIFLAPVLTLSILPIIFLFQITVISFEEELDKPYIEFAKGKGLSYSRILLVHVFKNAIFSIANHSKQVFWFMLSNLLVFEYVFNIYGFTQFFFSHYSPVIFFISLAMLLIPFFLIFTIWGILIKNH